MECVASFPRLKPILLCVVLDRTYVQAATTEGSQEMLVNCCLFDSTLQYSA